ncbi:DUF3795 domain-containing protein [Acetobacterium sp.]|uniref:DUF3795 domain-containing protein n=1 Tax=Acetobacterium sp. TaxID=1872094 RepID=UPI002F3FBC23
MSEMRAELIAPCGMNCRLCMAYQREKKQCKGCNSNSGYKTNSCLKCIIKNCPTIQNNGSGFCYECDKFPCARLKQLDKRYRTKYHMSMIENLKFIKNNGIDAFLQQEEKNGPVQTAAALFASTVIFVRRVNPNI